MRERITFVHELNDSFSHEQVRVEGDSLLVQSLVASRQDRLTFALQELPPELRRALKQCHELHLRWATPRPYLSQHPFASRISPGLHVLLTPQTNQPTDLFGRPFQKVFGEQQKCGSLETYIQVNVMSMLFPSSPLLQCYGFLPSLAGLVDYLQQNVCPRLGEICFARVLNLHNADFLDLDYDATSQTLVLTLFWHAPSPVSKVWAERITTLAGRAKVEVGVLANEQAVEVKELSMGGYLVVIGEDKQLIPTRFSFPSRHHLLSSDHRNTFSASFGFPTGLHPNLQLSLSHARTKNLQPSCTLYAYLTLPSFLFLDKYQLSSPNFLKSVNLHSIRALSGETDLEAPDWSISKWGSTVLLELAPPKNDSNRDGVWHATLPLHLRYLPPTAKAVDQVEIPWPTVFWACPAEEGTEMSVNPFDRVILGYDGSFAPGTIFYHLQPQLTRNDSLVERLEVPVLELSSLERIENETMTVVLAGVLWIIWKTVKIFRKP